MNNKLSKTNFLEELYAIIEQRAKGHTGKSYTNKLLKQGSKKIAQKIGEESTELVIDYLNGTKKRVVEETADLIYHILVLLYSNSMSTGR